MPRRRVALGDGYETGQPRFGGQQVITTRIERGLPHLIANGQKQPVRVEQKIKFHRHRHGSRGLLQRPEPCIPGARGSGPILQMAVKTGANRFGPEQQIRAKGIVFLDGDLAGGFHERRRGFDKIGQPLRVALVQREGDERGFVVEPPQGDALRSTRFAQPSRLAPRQFERVGHATATLGVRQRQTAPRLAGVGQRDEVSGQIAAIDRGHILRVERMEILRIVPVEEMAAMAGHPMHGRERRLQPLGGVQGADPPQIARAGDRHQIKADVRR